MSEVQRMVYNVCCCDAQAPRSPKATGREETLEVAYFLKYLTEMLRSCIREKREGEQEGSLTFTMRTF